MEDISIHLELEKNSNKIIKQVSNKKLNEMIEKLNKMSVDFNDSLCNNLFHNLFDVIIKFTEKEIRDKLKYFNIFESYETSNFALHSNLYNEIKSQFESDKNTKYFDIPTENHNLISSKKTLLIQKVYQKICTKMQPFFIFRFGVIKNEKNDDYAQFQKTGESNIETFLLKSKYLDLPLTSFTMNASQYDDIYTEDFLYLDYLDFLVKNEVSFDENILKRKYIADRMISAYEYAKKVKFFFKRFIDTTKNEIFYEIIDSNLDFGANDKKVVYFQTFADFCLFRSFAAINIKDFKSTNYFKKYFIHCLSLRDKEDQPIRKKKQNDKIDRDFIIKKIVNFRNKSILDIFISPIQLIYNNDNSDLHNESLICQKIISTRPYEIDDIALQAYTKFNIDTRSIKEKIRKDFLSNCIKNKSLNNENKDLFISMMIFYAISEWETNKFNDLLPSFNIMENVNKFDFDFSEVTFDIKKIKLNQSKFKSFGNFWKSDIYHDFDWNFKGDCLIDEIQSMFNQGSLIKPKFRKWLLSGFEKKEPLSIIGLRRYLNSPTNENKIDLAKVLDPFYGNVKIVDLFIDYIKDKIFNGNQYPFNDLTEKVKKENVINDNCKVNNGIDFRTIFKFSSSKNILYEFRSSKPLIAQYIWFHVAFNDPSKYPLTTLIIEKTPFFIDFQAAPKIIASIIHLRHIFSYNPVYIPIILHCTSLFKNSKCKILLYSLNYFDELLKKDFKDIQNEVDLLENYIKNQYKREYEILINQSAYYQIEFILQIYINEYNIIVEEIKKSTNQKNYELDFIELSSILSNSLITNLSLINVLLPLIFWSDKRVKFNDFEELIVNVFTNDCCKLFDYAGQRSIPLFKISYKKKEKDFVGFSSKDYEALFRYPNKIKKIQVEKLIMKNDEQKSINFHASVLSFFLDLYLNKYDDIGSDFDQNKINDLSNCYLNSYPNKIDYSLKINDKNVVLNKNEMMNSLVISYEENTMYPIQSIFKLLPKELRDYIRKLQIENKKGLKIIDKIFSFKNNKLAVV